MKALQKYIFDPTRRKRRVILLLPTTSRAFWELAEQMDTKDVRSILNGITSSVVLTGFYGVSPCATLTNCGIIPLKNKEGSN